MGEASIVVGNILFDFDYDTMASVWNVPNESFRLLAKEAMKDHIITLDDIGSMVKMDKLADQLVDEYETHLGRTLNPGGMTIDEIERAGQIGAVLRSESFLNSMDEGNGSSKRKPLKISRNVFIHYDEIEMDGLKLMGSFRIEDGKIHTAKLDDGDDELENKLTGKQFIN